MLCGDGGEVRLREETTDVRPEQSLGNAQTPDRNNPQQRADGGVTELRRRETAGLGLLTPTASKQSGGNPNEDGKQGAPRGQGRVGTQGQEEAESSKGSGI